MAATIRDRETKAEINGRNVSHCVSGIKASFTQFSRAYAGTQAASQFVCEAQSLDFCLRMSLATDVRTKSRGEHVCMARS